MTLFRLKLGEFQQYSKILAIKNRHIDEDNAGQDLKKAMLSNIDLGKTISNCPPPDPTPFSFGDNPNSTLSCLFNSSVDHVANKEKAGTE
jgi:hypothetical protein